MSINLIENPIEQHNTGKGVPGAILHYGSSLNTRQAQLLALLPKYDSRALLRKSDVNMKDLAALTAVTGNEFAMFTSLLRKSARLS